MAIPLFINKKKGTLRMYITLVITVILAVSLILSGIFFYKKTANILIENQKQQVMKELSPDVYKRQNTWNSANARQ